MTIGEALDRLVRGGSLSEVESEAVFDQAFSGSVSEGALGAILALMQAQGVRVEEVVGAARAMRRHAVRVPVAAGADLSPIVDTCGTGGAPKTFNVSTAAALIAAAAARGRARFAKHGNRSRTGRGSAEVLARLGVNVDAGPDVQARCLDRVGVCFCFAIHHHPAARHAAAVRRALPFPTIFNLLGPLTNPAGATRQVLGVYEPRAVALVAEALRRLGTERAMVLHSEDGLDELTVTARTTIAHVDGGGVRTELFDPAALGLPRRRREELCAADLDQAVRWMADLLDGQHGAVREMAVLNASAALVVAGVATDLREGLTLAEQALDSGAARQTLDALARESHAQ